MYCRIKSGHADCTLFDQQSPPGKWQPTLVQRLCAVMQVVKIGGTCVSAVELYTGKMKHGVNQVNRHNEYEPQKYWLTTVCVNNHRIDTEYRLNEQSIFAR